MLTFAPYAHAHSTPHHTRLQAAPYTHTAHTLDTDRDQMVRFVRDFFEI
jgi:hypothetical protein